MTHHEVSEREIELVFAFQRIVIGLTYNTEIVDEEFIKAATETTFFGTLEESKGF